MPAPPFTISGIDHVLLHVNGMDRNVAFYQNVLGCTVERCIPRVGMAELQAGTSHIDLVDIASPEGAWAKSSVDGGRNMDHFALAIESRDIQSLRAHLRSHGVAVTEEREEGGPKAKSLSLYVRDPSGNAI
ncbi:MAG TPA: VOC family protein, partial [Candidatus Rubrimentiphilum sp.]|nr:VOC family protein [Candidatus Rubrimentiphilum sp.]